MEFENSLEISNLQSSSDLKLQGEPPLSKKQKYYLARDKSGGAGAYPLSHLDNGVCKSFFIPLVEGRPLTPEILGAKPDPYIIQTPLIKSNQPLPAVFGGGDWFLGISTRRLDRYSNHSILEFINLFP